MFLFVTIDQSYICTMCMYFDDKLPNCGSDSSKPRYSHFLIMMAIWVLQILQKCRFLSGFMFNKNVGDILQIELSFFDDKA